MKQKIYLAGGMTLFNNMPEEAFEWRDDFSKALEDSFNCINPATHFWFDVDTNESEAMNWDLHNVRHSDLVIVNFNDPKSIGTAMELAIAHELRIPIIGLNEDNINLHPWLSLVCERVFQDREELLLYIREYYE